MTTPTEPDPDLPSPTDPAGPDEPVVLDPELQAPGLATEDNTQSETDRPSAIPEAPSDPDDQPAPTGPLNPA
jgi:hypothetical protein